MTEETSRITGGLVMFEDAIKKDVGGDPQYWPSQRARAELTFVVAPGDDASTEVNKAQSMAFQIVDVFLGGNRPLPAALMPGEAPAPATTRKRRTQAEIAADKAAAEDQAQPGSAGGEPTSADPFDAGDAGPASPPATGDATSGDEWDTGPAVPEVTDADLGAACSKKNAVLKDSDKIRNLINEYNPDPNKVFQLREIPQAKRAEFLAKLEALK